MEKVDFKKEMQNLYQPSAKQVEGTCAQMMHIGPFSAKGPTPIPITSHS